MSTPPESHIPPRLGRYQLLERIAVGGMAEVYKAVALGLSGFEKSVVVKRLLPQHQRDQELLTMFVDEARLLGRLRHPNIAEVYDIDHEGNEYFFALEYVDGVELRELLLDTDEAALSIGECVWITHELAKALHYAHGLLDDEGHALGIVHRDISPSNVLISQSGAVKLVDFGVAKWRSQRSETRHGVLKGKVSYMSPEQCRGQPLDLRSDVFALGVLLYEMSVGCRPFAGSSDFETLKAIAEGHFIKPSGKRSEYPAALERLCVAMLELDPMLRPAHMGEVIDALQAFAATAGLSLGPQVLADRAAAAVKGRAPRQQGTGHIDEPPLADPTRFHVDRTATAVATVESLATAVTPMRESRPVARASWLKVSLGLVALAGGLGMIGLWLRPSAPPLKQTSVVAPVSTYTPLNVEKPRVDPLPAAASPPVVPDAKARVKGSHVNRQPHTRPRGSASAQPATPATVAPASAAVWDPDSPVPP